MIDKIRPRKLNASADSRLRKPDEMQDALNLVSSNDFRMEGDTTKGNDATGNAGVLKPVNGNKKLDFFNAFSTDGMAGQEHRVIGSVTDHVNDVIYFFVYHMIAEHQGVYAYDPKDFFRDNPAIDGEFKFKKIFTNAQFKFPSDGFIKADVVNISVPFEYGGFQYESQPVLYFTDNVNEPRKLHPLRARTETFPGYSNVDFKDFITACPKTPIHPIEAVYKNDILDPTSSFEGLPGFQFAYQHLYKGGEESALSTFSDIAVPPAYYTQGASVDPYLSSNNRCDLKIPSVISYDGASEETIIRTKEIKEVRILARVGNTGAWKVVEEVPVEDLANSNNVYQFYNRRIFGGFPQTDAIKPFDNIPQKAQAQAIVSDRLTYGNYVEGYDNVKVEAKATLIYHERPDDLTDLNIKVTPTIKNTGSITSEFNFGSGQSNKRAGYHINTDDIPDVLGAGSFINFELFVRPNRNFHIYNSHDSFHGSKHLSLEGDETESDGTTTVEAPQVWGQRATLENTCGGDGGLNVLQDLDTMWGRNTGVGAVDENGLPLLTWNTTSSQVDLEMPSVKCVFGTSAANPFILRGSNLHFSVRLKVLGDPEAGDEITAASATIKNALIAALSGSDTYDYEENDLQLMSSKSTSTYFINEGLSGGNAGTSTEAAISGAHRIPVSSGGDTGGDDRKHLICAVGNYTHATQTAKNNQSPCGYFIVNKAEVSFGLNDIGNGFLELDLASLNDLEVLTAVPFIDAETWKDEAYESNASSCGIVNDGNDTRNYGVRDATYWSLDSLIIDSWYVYSKEYILDGQFNQKVYTPVAADFPRYMNGSNTDVTGLSPGDPNPESNMIGKNAAIVDIEVFGGNSGGFLDPTMYQIRSRGDALGWGEDVNCGNEFEQWYIYPYLKLVSQHGIADAGQGIATTSKFGRNRIIGYLQGDVQSGLYDPDKADLGAGNGISILDGAIGPGSDFHGGENRRKGFGQGDSSYTVGSVSGEMVFTGRIAPRGYIVPSKIKQGGRHQHLQFNNLWEIYGQGPMLPYLGGLYYQKGYAVSGTIGDTNISITAGNGGFIHNWYKTDQAGAQLGVQANIDSVLNSGPWNPGARYVGHFNLNDSNYQSENAARKDLFVSAQLDDAEINYTELEARVLPASELRAGGRSFKTRATHAFGLVYYDERGRSGNVNPIKFIEIDNEATNTEGVYVKGYSQEERNNKGRVTIGIEIENDPPEWAHNYQLVYGGNTTKGNFIQYTTGGACIANLNLNTEGSDEGEDPSSTNIYVSLNYLQHNKDVSYAEAFGAVSPLGRKELYTYKEGDKLRVLSYFTGPDSRVFPHNVEFDILGVETVTNNPEENIFRKAFEKDEDNNVVADFRTGQYLVLRNNPKAEGFNYSSVKEAENEAETTAHNWNDICVVEIYSPSKTVDDDERLFYETGRVYDIGMTANGTLYHKTNSIKLDKGDVWFRRGALAVPEFGDQEFDADGNQIESFGMFKNLIQRGNEEGDSSPRFRDYYVESMTFNDTFAGNNVIGIGKPKAIRPDEGQVRKRSSIIYSDKHNFSRRNIKFTSFNGTASNFKDLPGEYGAINYLQNNYDSLICIQENKTSTVPVERNIISDASGSNNLVTSNKVIGVQAFYAGEYGCDNNPESVVKTNSATYFASKAKSEVYKLTSQGIQVISDMGLKSYFFRIFEEAKKREADAQPSLPEKIYIPGGYDPLKDEFLITVGNLPFFNTAGEVTPLQPKLGEESVEEPSSGFEGFEDDVDVPDTEDPTQAAVVFSPADGYNFTPDDFAGGSATPLVNAIISGFFIGGNLQLVNTATLENLSETIDAVITDIHHEHVSGANLFSIGGGVFITTTSLQEIPANGFLSFTTIVRLNSMSLSDSEYQALAEEGVYVIESNPPQVVANHKVIIEIENAPDVEFNYSLTIPISDSIEEEVEDEEEVVDEEVVEDPFVDFRVEYSLDGANFRDSLEPVLLTNSNIVTTNELGVEVIGPSQKNIKVRVVNLGNVPGDIYLDDLTEEFFDIALNENGIKYTEGSEVNYLTYDDLPPDPTIITVIPEGFTNEDVVNDGIIQFPNAVIFDFTIVYTPSLFADEQFAVNNPDNQGVIAERDFTLGVRPLPGEYTISMNGGLEEIKVRLVNSDIFPDGEIWSPFDTNGDGEIGSADLLDFLIAYGTLEGVDEEYDSRFDNNDDGEIGSADLLAFLPSYGASFSDENEDEDEDEDNDNNEQP